jgi:hypothetical protein
MIYLIYILSCLAFFGLFVWGIFYIGDNSNSARMNRMIEEREKQRRREISRAVRRAKTKDKAREKDIKRRKSLGKLL